MSAKRMLLTILAASAVLLALVLGSQLAGGSVQARPPAQPSDPANVTVPYPGRLADAAGQPVPDGAYDFAFTLYTAETGGAPLWSEMQTGVPVQDGAFQATLGNGTSLPQEALADALWLAVAVRGPGETDFTALAPRQQVSAAATAPDSPSAGLACPHDHWGESWAGSGVGLSTRSNNWVGLVGVGTTSMIINPLPLGVYGVYGRGDDAGVIGESDTGTGVTGGSNSGDAVRGISTNGVGVRGESTNHDGVRGEASASNRSGVYGYNSGSGYGMAGRSVNGWGLEADGNDDGPFTSRKGDLLLDGSYGDIFTPGFLRLWSDVDVYVIMDANNDGFNSFTLFNGAGSAVFNVNESGNLWAAGSKAALVETPNRGPRLVYAVESPEVWIEDFGTAALVNGKAIVSIEPIFAETVNLEMDYHVFLTPLGDCKGLYVAAKSPTSFEVRELGGGTASTGFDYRVVAKRRGYENTRLESPKVPASPDGK
ncbi:MAG: hypothetical protein KKB13_04515 [Chloroflexi bacterium]|nr:hypothetical protein [Chloroflexota bacterium]